MHHHGGDKRHHYMANAWVTKTNKQANKKTHNQTQKSNLHEVFFLLLERICPFGFDLFH